MRTAILLSGHMRSFELCLPTLHWHVFRHFPGASFIVAAFEDEDVDKVNLLQHYYPESAIHVDRVREQPLFDLPPAWPPSARQPWDHAPYAISVDPQAILGQLWMLRRVWSAFDESGQCADLIIRCRPDLFVHSSRLHQPSWASGHLPPFGHVAHVPWWGRFGGINDRFALLSKSAAPHYFDTFDRVAELVRRGCPLHPESLIAASLEAGGVKVDPTLRIEFSTLRKNGQMRPPEISAIDLAHASMAVLRTD
jgi:hypothetical protein